MLAVAAVHLAIGGLRAVYWTDVMQGVWMYVAVWAGALVLSFELFGGRWSCGERSRASGPTCSRSPAPKASLRPGSGWGW